VCSSDLLGADLRQLTEQDKFIDHIVDAATVGLGSTVDADIAKESARLQAQQVARELSAEVLNIANARPNIVGQLFNFGG
jgi:flagellin